MSEDNTPKIVTASASLSLKDFRLGAEKAALVKVDPAQEKLKRQVADISDSLEFLFEKLEALEQKVNELTASVEKLNG